MLTTLLKSALTVVVIAFAGVVLLDPGDKILHLKLPLLILALCIWAIRVVCGMVNPGSLKVVAGVLLFALILPAAASLIALLGDTLPVGEPLQFQLIKEFSVLLIIPVVVSERIDLTALILRWSIVIAIFTLLLAGLSLVEPSLFAIVRGIAVETDNAFIRSRAELGLGIGSFYYKTVSVLVFPIAYHLRKMLNGSGKLASAMFTLMFVAAILCSDSRAAVIGVFIVVAFFVTQKLKIAFGWPPALFALLVMVVLPAGYFAAFFHPEELSNATKIGHIHSYARLFNDHPTYLLWGQGADTEFYTQGFEAKTTLTELTYLDLIRWFGIPVAALILGAVVYPIFALAQRANASSYLVVPYIAYLWEAASNPLLICSFGALVVSAMWGRTLLFEAEESSVAQRSLCVE